VESLGGKKVSRTICFEVEHAKEYGIECAVLIWHFRFWIENNRANQRNRYEGRTWSYNTLDALLVLFPFTNKSSLGRYLNYLVESGVLVKGNFNKNKFDRTAWYAFKDEDNWIREEFKKVLPFPDPEKCISPNREMGVFESGNAQSQIGTTIPDIIPDIKTNTSLVDTQNSGIGTGSLTPSANADPRDGNFYFKKEEKPKEKSLEQLFDEAKASEVAIKALEMAQKLHEKVLESCPTAKPPDLKKWAKEFELIHSRDKRSWDDISFLIEWAHKDIFWKANIRCPKKLREKWDDLIARINAQKEKSVIENNRSYAGQVKNHLVKKGRGAELTLVPSFACNSNTGKEIPYTLPAQNFKDIILGWYGLTDDQ
jgi:hypothetical protein